MEVEENFQLEEMVGDTSGGQVKPPTLIQDANCNTSARNTF